MEASSHRPSSLTPGSTNSSTHFFRRDPISNKGDKRKSLEMAQTYTMDLVRRAIKSCRNSKAFGTDKLSITPLQPLSHDMSDTDDMQGALITPTPKPGKDTPKEFNISPSAKVLETLMLPTINKYLLLAPDQHGFRQTLYVGMVVCISWTRLPTVKKEK